MEKIQAFNWNSEFWELIMKQMYGKINTLKIDPKTA